MRGLSRIHESVQGCVTPPEVDKAAIQVGDEPNVCTFEVSTGASQGYNTRVDICR